MNKINALFAHNKDRKLLSLYFCAGCPTLDEKGDVLMAKARRGIDLVLDKDSVDLDMGIAIRSMWSREGRLFWQAGGGIVHDSDAALEWKEVCNKSAIMRLVLEESDDHVPAHR